MNVVVLFAHLVEFCQLVMCRLGAGTSRYGEHPGFVIGVRNKNRLRLCFYDDAAVRPPHIPQTEQPIGPQGAQSDRCVPREAGTGITDQRRGEEEDEGVGPDRGSDPDADGLQRDTFKAALRSGV